MDSSDDLGLLFKDILGSLREVESFSINSFAKIDILYLLLRQNLSKLTASVSQGEHSFCFSSFSGLIAIFVFLLIDSSSYDLRSTL